MTQRQSMSRLRTEGDTGRAARERAEQRAAGWPTAILRIVGWRY